MSASFKFHSPIEGQLGRWPYSKTDRWILDMVNRIENANGENEQITSIKVISSPGQLVGGGDSLATSAGPT